MRKTAIAVVLIISTIILFPFGATLYQHYSTGGYVEPEVIEGTVIDDTYIMTTGNLFAGTDIRKGEKVKVMAEMNTDGSQYLWVENSRGQRGMMFRSFVECERPAYRLVSDDSRYKMTMSDFYEESIGKSFEELDSRYRKVIFIEERPAKGNEVKVGMHFHLHDPNDWKSYRPVVTFKDGIATDVEYERISNSNRWALRFAPYAYRIYSSRFIPEIVSRPQLVKSSASHDSKVMDILYLILVGYLPLILLSLFLLWPAPLKFVPNIVLSFALPIIGAVSVYIWYVVCMLEGYSWWYMLLILITGLTANIAWGIYYISLRCTNCKHIATNVLIDSLHYNTYNDTQIRFVTRYSGGTSKDIHGTIITREIRTSDNKVMSESSRKGVIGHEETSYYTRMTIHDDYEVKEYYNTYRCSHCGNIVTKDENKRRLTSSKVVDRKVTSNTTSHYKYPRE